jgi:hypothetical protein
MKFAWNSDWSILIAAAQAALKGEIPIEIELEIVNGICYLLKRKFYILRFIGFRSFG